MGVISKSILTFSFIFLMYLRINACEEVKFKNGTIFNPLNKKCFIALMENNNGELELISKEFVHYVVKEDFYYAKKAMCYGIMGRSKICGKMKDADYKRYHKTVTIPIYCKSGVIKDKNKCKNKK